MPCWLEQKRDPVPPHAEACLVDALRFTDYDLIKTVICALSLPKYHALQSPEPGLSGRCWVFLKAMMKWFEPLILDSKDKANHRNRLNFKHHGHGEVLNSLIRGQWPYRTDQCISSRSLNFILRLTSHVHCSSLKRAHSMINPLRLVAFETKEITVTHGYCLGCEMDL